MSSIYHTIRPLLPESPALAAVVALGGFIAASVVINVIMQLVSASFILGIVHESLADASVLSLSCHLFCVHNSTTAPHTIKERASHGIPLFPYTRKHSRVRHGSLQLHVREQEKGRLSFSSLRIVAGLVAPCRIALLQDETR